MRDQHRLGALHVSVRRHDGVTGAFRLTNEGGDEIGKGGADGVETAAGEEAQVGGDLLVTAASGVQLVTGVADEGDQFLLDELVNILNAGFVEVSRLLDNGESIEDLAFLGGGKDTRAR